VAGCKDVDPKGRAFSEQLDDTCDDPEESLDCNDGKHNYPDDEVPLFPIVVLNLRDSIEREDWKCKNESEEDSSEPEDDMHYHPERPVFVEGENDCEVDDEGPDVEHRIVVGKGAPGVLDLQHSSFKVFH